MKVAVIQFNATADKSRNIRRAVKFVEKAIKRGAEFILLPEVFIYRGRLRKPVDVQKIAESTSGPSLKPFMDLARRHKVFILAGSIYEKVKGAKKAYNTSVVINPQGRISAKYRKTNLFDAIVGKQKVRESDFFHVGNKPTLTKVKKFNVGLSICYDLRFPSLYQGYAKRGADVLCVPSAFTEKTGKAHWETLLRSRAIENLCYVLAPNQIGKDGRGILYYGNSMIIDPWGKVIARASKRREQILFAKLQENLIKHRRSLLPAIHK